MAPSIPEGTGCDHLLRRGEYVTRKHAPTLVAGVLNALPAAARPVRIEKVEVVGKLEEPCIALPDIFLGAWQQFATGWDPKCLQIETETSVYFVLCSLSSA